MVQHFTAVKVVELMTLYSLFIDHKNHQCSFALYLLFFNLKSD
jgi:hypothetical protein